jgi:hypothetical protein
MWQEETSCHSKKSKEDTSSSCHMKKHLKIDIQIDDHKMINKSSRVIDKLLKEKFKFGSMDK